MTAAKFGDPVLGLDIHMVIIPGPPGTAPLPHPFVGAVFDPLGAAMGAAIGAIFGGGGPVFVNGMPTGNSGTDVMNIPHFPTPPGTGPAPPDAPPDNEGTILTGSKTVNFGGSSQARELSHVISCSYPVDLPSSIVTPIPGGPPVNIGGPEAIDYMVAATSALKGAFKHAKGKWGKSVSSWAHKKFNLPSGSKRSKFVCFLTGHPVDVASGELIADATDFELGGAILPIQWERNYRSREGRHPILPSLSSYLKERTPALGPAWFHPYDSWIEEEPAGEAVYLAGADGRPKAFGALRYPGDTSWDPEDRQTLARTASGFELIHEDGIRWIYSPTDSPRPGAARNVYLPVAIIDPSDNRLELRYQRGQLSSIHDAAGRIIECRWADQRLESLWLTPAPDQYPAEPQLLVRYAYQEGRLSRVTDARGFSMHYAWSGGVLIQETHKSGLQFHFAWDLDHPDGNCIRTWGENQHFSPDPGAKNALPRILFDRRITYVKERRLTTVEDGRGGITRYHTNALGLVDELYDPAGNVTRYSYSPQTWKLSEEDALGNVTSWTWDPQGRLLSETNPLGKSRYLQYDPQGNPSQITDEAGATTTLQHDHRRLLLLSESPAGDLTRRSYDPQGRLTRIEDPMGRSLHLSWSSAHNLQQIRSEDRVTQFSHDHHGRTISSIDPMGRQERLERDPSGLVLYYQRADGEALTYQYDAEGNPTRQTDSRGRSITMRYAGMDQLIEHIDPLGHSVKLFYDTDTDLIAVENQHGETYSFQLDKAGRVQAERTFSGTRRKYLYDKAGRTAQVWSGAYRLTKYQRDPLGRVIQQTSQGGNPNSPTPPAQETFSYDDRGYLISAQTPDGQVAFQRDQLGRIIAEQETLTTTALSATIKSHYDRSGLRTQRNTSFGHRTEYQYNAQGELTALSTDWDLSQLPHAIRSALPQTALGAFQVKIARDRLGQETARRLPGGVTSVWTRDPYGRPQNQTVLTGATTQTPGTNVALKTYAWSSPEEIASITTQTPNGKTLTASQYQYDPRGHLIRQIFSSGETLDRQSDPAGNLFRSQDKTDRRYGPGGVIQQANGTQYTVDPDGFLTKKVLSDGATWHYLWSPQGELTQVTRPDGKTVTFTYDNFGRRTTKTYDGKITEYIWDGDDLIHERTTDKKTAQTQPLTTWIQEPGTFTPLAKIQGRKRYGIVSDHLGTPTFLATEAGKIAWHAQLDIYGVPREQPALVDKNEQTDNPWRFPGQYEDPETGLYYNRFRYYDPELGRYLSEDPIGLLGGEALYGYVHEPLGWWDPLGLACGPATKLDGKGRWRDANGKFARKPQVSKLAPLKGKRVPTVEKTLRDSGFTRTNPANPKNQRWVHPDRSEVQIHAYGGMNTTPYKAGNNAHAHKSVGKHLENGTIELDDSGGRQVHAHSDAAHIGLKNPANFPTVSGRSHGQ